MDRVVVRNRKVSRQALKKMLQKSALWEPAVARRDWLKEHGLTTKESWEIIFREYGSTNEKGEGIIRIAIPGIPPYGDESEYGVEDSIAAAPSPEMLADVEEEPPVDEQVYEDFDTPVIAGGTVDKRLAEKQQTSARKKNITELDIVRWVFENMDVKDVGPKDAPTPGAYSLLKHCRGNAGTQMKFYTDMWSKTIPTKSRLDEEQKRVDSGGELVEMYNHLIDIRHTMNNSKEEEEALPVEKVEEEEEVAVEENVEVL